MDTSKLPKIKTARDLLRVMLSSARTRKATLFLGPPGVGKTAIASQFAREVHKRLVFFDVGNSAREDAVIPVVIDGKVILVPQGPLKAACEQGVVLFLDEMGHASKDKQALAMAITNERRVGEYQLHPDTVVLLAGNDVGTGGLHTLMLPLVGRVCMVYFTGDREDALKYLSTLGSDDPNAPAIEQRIREVAEDYTATAMLRTELIEMEPKEGVAEDPEPVPQPRQVENAIVRLADMIAAGEPIDDVALAIVSGHIGRHAAASYFAVRKLRDKLPTPDEIVKSPDSCTVPPDMESSVAVLGVLKQAQSKNVNSAWQYAARIKVKEVRAAATRSMLGKVPTNPNALKAFNTLIGEAGNVLKRTAA